MAINVSARCSECYSTIGLEIGPNDEEISCPVCGHSVPNFEPDDFDRIAYHQEKSKKATVISCAAFGGAIVFFLLFLSFGEAEEPNQAISMILGLFSLAGVIASMVFGWQASAERIVAEI